MMIRKITRILKIIFKILTTPLTFIEKIEAFKILVFCYIKAKFKKENEEITQKIFGFKVTAHNYRNLNFLFKEIFLSEEYKIESSQLSTKIIDCGANIGMALLYFKKKHPNCSILAFEPNPNLFKLLEKNVAQNNLTNVQLLNFALSNFNGKIDFFVNNNKGTLTGSFFESRSGENKIVVEVKKLSSYIHEEKIDILKMDIEGAEMSVVDDLVKNGKLKLINRYLVEYHHRIKGMKTELSSFLKYFIDNDFKYNIRTDFKTIGDFQNIFLNIYQNDEVS